MTQAGLVVDRERDRSEIGDVAVTSGRPVTSGWPDEAGERDARNTLKQQIARLERECSAIVADGFPHISLMDVPVARSEIEIGVGGGPCLLTLAELERMRDRLVGRAQDMRRIAAERVEHERAARELLEGMKLEPGRYRFTRLPVRDLGQGGCGVWEVRPRLGLIGMLAGWWHVKLSSGCPLARGPRERAAPDSPLPASRSA
jgi:hypothetical protein